MWRLMKKILDQTIEYARFVGRRFAEDRCMMVAGSLTYTSLLALVPVFAVTIALTAQVPPVRNFILEVKGFMLKNLLPDVGGRMVSVYMEQFAQNAAQLTKDLQPLLPEKASLTANEAGNALVLTDTQSSIHRMAEIVRALDTSVAGIATIRVFQMRYADAKTVATVIKEVFQPETAGGRGGNNNADPRAAFFARFSGGGGGGGRGGEGGGGGGGAAANGRTTAASRVVAVADERSNSLVVSSPDELMATIEDLVKSVDTK